MGHRNSKKALIAHAKHICRAYDENELIDYLETTPVKWHVEYRSAENLAMCSVYFSFRKDADAIEYMLRFSELSPR
jgi:hypothetical protein